eukprot:tig00000571_g2164.t1
MFAYAVGLDEIGRPDDALRACRAPAALDVALARRDAGGYRDHSDRVAVLYGPAHWEDEDSRPYLRCWALNVMRGAGDEEAIATLTSPSFAPERFVGDDGFLLDPIEVFEAFEEHEGEGRARLAAELAAYCVRAVACCRVDRLDAEQRDKLLGSLAHFAVDPELPAATRGRALAALPAAEAVAASSVSEECRNERLGRAIEVAVAMPMFSYGFRERIPSKIACCAFYAEEEWLPAPATEELGPYYARLDQLLRWEGPFLGRDDYSLEFVLGAIARAGADESVPAASRAAGEATLPPVFRAALALQRAQTAAGVVPDILGSAMSAEDFAERGIAAAECGASALALCAALLAPPAAPGPAEPAAAAAEDEDEDEALRLLARAAARRAVELGGAPGLRPLLGAGLMQEGDVRAVAAAAPAILALDVPAS